MREAPLGMLVTYTHITPRDDFPIRKVMQHACIQLVAYPLGEESEHLLVVLGEPRDERLQLRDLLLPLYRTLGLLRRSPSSSFELLFWRGRRNC